MAHATGAVAPASPSGAEQAPKRRGQRGNGRRLRRRIVDAQNRRDRARLELAAFDPWRTYVLARIDAELAQLQWEVKTRWTGEPGQGPPVPQRMPLPARPGVPPREVFLVRTLTRPWRGEAGT